MKILYFKSKIVLDNFNLQILKYNKTFWSTLIIESCGDW